MSEGWAGNRCTKFAAQGYVNHLVGDPDFTTPDGRPMWHLFGRLSSWDAQVEYLQIAQLPEHDRLRDMLDRLEIDKRRAG